MPKKDFGRYIDFDDETVGRDGEHRMRQRIQQFRGSSRKASPGHFADRVGCARVRRFFDAHAASCRSCFKLRTEGCEKRFNLLRISLVDKSGGAECRIRTSRDMRHRRRDVCAHGAAPAPCRSEPSKRAIMFERTARRARGAERRCAAACRPPDAARSRRRATAGRPRRGRSSRHRRRRAAASSSASARLLQSPLATTGSEVACFTARIAAQSALP